MKKQKIVVLTGAGISAESGIKTFRASDGLWENHDVQEVASPEGWKRNRELVLEFYNQRRAQALAAQPNAGHLGLAQLESHYEVVIVTQNIDDLHEKAGSTNIIHLHGELSKAHSTVDPNLVYDWGNKPINIGDKCDKGSQLRPHIVWFGEAVPLMEKAVMEVADADIFMVVGTSLLVYPAAGLLDYVDDQVPKYIIDPNMPEVRARPNLHLIEDKGSVGVPTLAEKLIAKAES